MIRGTEAYLKWRCYFAADIHGYSVMRTKGGAWHLSAHVVVSDAFKVTQRPLTFVATVRTVEWRWPVLTHEIHPDTKRLTAQLGAPEVIKV